MKILLLSQHPPLVPTGSAHGEQIRAHHLTLGLKSAGHEVEHMSVASLPNSPVQRVASIEKLGTDAVLSLSIEIMADLNALSVPLILDLYAPRIQESVFSDELSPAALHTLRALSSADVFLVSNTRQRWHWLGLLTLAGIDTRSDPTLLVPLSCDAPIHHPTSEDMTFIAGGCNWPWQDPSDGVRCFLRAIENHPTARLRWMGAWPKNLSEKIRSHPRIEHVGWLPYDEYRNQIATASAAFDWYEPNPERELALAFRHMDYLGSGLPILGYPNTALDEIVGNAACLSDKITDTVENWLANPKLQNKTRRAARSLAKKFHWKKTSKSLCDWLDNPKKRTQGHPLLLEWANKIADYDTQNQAHVRLQTELDAFRSEVEEKREELTRLTEQIQTQLGIIDRLARSVDEITGFKREAIQVLDTRIQHHSQSSDDLSRENAILRADIEKKTAELEAMDQLRARLENDLSHAHQALETAKQKKQFWR